MTSAWHSPFTNVVVPRHVVQRHGTYLLYMSPRYRENPLYTGPSSANLFFVESPAGETSGAQMRMDDGGAGIQMPIVPPRAELLCGFSKDDLSEVSSLHGSNSCGSSSPCTDEAASDPDTSEVEAASEAESE